jgi:hypothetical protein
VVAIEYGEHPLLDSVLPDRLREIRLRELVVVDMQVAQIELIGVEVQVCPQELTMKIVHGEKEEEQQRYGSK